MNHSCFERREGRPTLFNSFSSHLGGFQSQDFYGGGVTFWKWYVVLLPGWPMTERATPTSPPPPAVLDLQPASMSFLGHRDCPANGTFVCYARVVSGSANQSELNWSAYTNVPGKIVFSPSSGALAPGQSVVVTITIPSDACKAGIFFLQGPVNTHSITWAC